jgi:hypothetical protein
MRDHEAMRHLLLRVLAARGGPEAEAMAASLEVAPKEGGAFALRWEGGEASLLVEDFALYPRGDTERALARRDPKAGEANQARAEAWVDEVLGAAPAASTATAEEAPEPYGPVLGVLLGAGWFLGWASPGGLFPALGAGAIVGVARRLRLPARPLLGTVAPWLGVLTVTGAAEGLAHGPAACVSLAVLFWATWEGCRHRGGLALGALAAGVAAQGGPLAAFFALGFLVAGLALPRRPACRGDLLVAGLGGAAGVAAPCPWPAAAPVGSALAGVGVVGALLALLMTGPFVVSGRHRYAAPIAAAPWLALWALASVGTLPGLVLSAAALAWASSQALWTGREFLALGWLGRAAPALGVAWGAGAALVGSLL